MSGILILLYCPEKVPTLKQAPTLQFLQFSGFLRFCVEPPAMLNSCVVNLKVRPLSSHSCDCVLDATTSGIKGSHTPIHGLVRSILSLQHDNCILQAMTELSGNLATRLQVGQLCSMIQLSPLSGWPRRSTKQRCSTPWQLSSHLGWALARG